MRNTIIGAAVYCCTLGCGSETTEPESALEPEIQLSSGTWLVRRTPTVGPKEVYCQNVLRIGVTNDFIWDDWTRSLGLLGMGSVSGPDVEITGAGKWNGMDVGFTATGTTNGDSLSGSYMVTGAIQEDGTFEATHRNCKSLRTWLRQWEHGNQDEPIMSRGFGLDIDAYDLVSADGASVTSASVDGPLTGGPIPMSTTGDGATFSEFFGQNVPMAGDGYSISVVYSDGDAQTAVVEVRPLVVGFPALLSPAAGDTVSTLTPTFTWEAPACACQSRYQILVTDLAWSGMWETHLGPSATTVTYAEVGQAIPLVAGRTYQWLVLAFDPEITGGSENYRATIATFTVTGS